jgi:hypothetical protein
VRTALTKSNSPNFKWRWFRSLGNRIKVSQVASPEGGYESVDADVEHSVVDGIAQYGIAERNQAGTSGRVWSVETALDITSNNDECRCKRIHETVPEAVEL